MGRNSCLECTFWKTERISLLEKMMKQRKKLGIRERKKEKRCARMTKERKRLEMYGKGEERKGAREKRKEWKRERTVFIFILTCTCVVNVQTLMHTKSKFHLFTT